MNALAALTPLTQETEETTIVHAEGEKYGYPEFAGWVGERYLKKLLCQILSMALYRTWEIFVEHQANGNDCYLGLSQLAASAGRTLRTMQRNLAELEAKHLLVERAERKLFCGSHGRNSARVVVIKDFSNLYAFAHEYHEWLTSANYVAPDRAVLTFLLQDMPLIAKLRRFNNYRRVLYNQIPGPQPRPSEEICWFTHYRDECFSHAEPASPEDQGEQMVTKKATKEVANKQSKDSPRRIIERVENTISMENASDSILPISEKARKKGRETLANPQGKDSTRDNGQELREQQTYTPPQNSPLSYPSPLGLSDENSLQQTRSGGKPEGEQASSSSSCPQALNLSDVSSTDENRGCSPDVPLAHSFVQEIAVAFGDRNPKGSITRLRRIITEHGLQSADVVYCLVRAYIVARDTNPLRLRHRDPHTGSNNRMPLFCALFERFAQACGQGNRWKNDWQQIEDNLVADPLLVTWCNRQQKLIREVLEHHVCKAGNEQHVHACVSGEEKPAREPQEASECLLRHRPSKCSQTEEGRENRAASARSLLIRLQRGGVPIHEPIVLWEHLICGCPLYHKRNGKEVCALCFPDPEWPDEVVFLIRSLVQVNSSVSSSEDGSQETPEQASVGVMSASDADQQHADRPAGWSDQEEACAYGSRLQEAMTTSGYQAAVQIRPAGSRYQVVLLGEDCELVCEGPEQIIYVIEQVRKGKI